ncbi:MAG TPA: hypothetical protein VFO27_16240, partial [Bryobacteraceae bacterium]|nr:hypothetical protein [Bryobacteraceae bacterium]
MRANSDLAPAVRRLGAAGLLAAMLLLSAIPQVGAQQPATTLSPGWNNVLYTGAPGAVATALAALSGNLSAVLIWDSLGQRWHQYYPGNPDSSDLQSLTPGQVYWIAVQSAATLPGGLASPSPTQIIPGWNNVAYLGSGSPGASTLEQ